LATPQKIEVRSTDSVELSPQSSTSILSTSASVSATPFSPISQLKLSSSSSSADKREKHKPMSGKGGSKKLKKKETSSSHASESSSTVCYGIERSLQLYRSNVKQLTEYLSTLSPEKVFKQCLGPGASSSSSGVMLESSVIADLLLAVSLCYGTLLSDWDRVYRWYEICSADLPSKEFDFILLLLTKEQKNEMRNVLMSSQVRGEGEEGEGERLDRILRTYRLI
jgi:hypothetical protein